MPGVLLDTHALIWFLSEEPMEDVALAAIGEAQAVEALFVSPISAWDAALALRHRNPARRPNLNEQDAATWFRRGREAMGAKLIKVGVRIALEAARVPGICNHGDPGDCYLIATARTYRLPIVTRDTLMHELSARMPGYLNVVRC
ncbi:MAG: type II toxin-antitoxin system VapC family toxin [Fimbriimonadaceae bacterium]